MKNYTFKFILSALLFSSIYLNAQEFTVESNLDNLSIEVGEIFEPITNIINKNGNKVECPNIIYYNKNGALNWDDGISINRRRGTIKGEIPGQHVRWRWGVGVRWKYELWPFACPRGVHAPRC